MAKRKKTIEEEYVSLDQISHVLLRPQTYLGSNKKHTSSKWVINKNKMILKEVTFIPSFMKIFDEIITNSVDEHKRNPKLNSIQVEIDQKQNKITIKDNGGIPVVIHKKYKKYVPEVIFGDLMSGSNYDDTQDRNVAGLNGLGAKLTNIFSTSFSISTCDGKKSFEQTFTENMRKRTKPQVKAKKTRQTQITYQPDLSQFGMKSIDNDHFLLLQKRCYEIAACNPKLQVTFNDQKITNNDFNDYVKLYVDDFISDSSKDWQISVSRSESGFQQISYVNSTETYDGGTHVDYIMNQIISELRAYFKRSHKVDVKPSDIKNHMTIFLNCTVINPYFSSQTKEKLISEQKDFKTSHLISKKFIQSLIKSDIISDILDWIAQKKLAEEKRKERKLNKNLSNIKVQKLIDAKSKTRWKCSIGIFEGDSAISAFRKYRTPDTMGAFALKGKFMNVTDISSDRFMNNKEVVNLMASIGLKLGVKANLKDLRYGRILIYTDADVDGNSISGLLINFFYRYWPELFEMGMIYKVDTPIVVAINKKKRSDQRLFYNNDEYVKWSNRTNTSNWEIKYKKGLAALVDDEYRKIIQDPKLVKIESSKTSEQYLDIWFGKDSEKRKEEIMK